MQQSVEVETYPLKGVVAGGPQLVLLVVVLVLLTLVTDLNVQVHKYVAAEIYPIKGVAADAPKVRLFIVTIMQLFQVQMKVFLMLLRYLLGLSKRAGAKIRWQQVRSVAGQ